MSEVGRLIADRYRLTEHIGSGAMGVVWQAHDERLHRTVALKQLLLQPGLSAADAHEARERAMREGRIAARLQHPNAVTVYDVVEDGGQPVLIMEYVPSKSLSAVLDERGPLAPQDVARIGAQVAVALTAAHNAGIVHRDIKPGNVLLTEDGTAKITDFGISRATGDVTVTATGMLAGTPAYLAPEVAKGENPGPPSDVFSLASTMYAAIEGQPPFGVSDNTLALLHAVAACRTIPPRRAGPMTALLMQMLRPDPQERPTMAESGRALGAVATGQDLPRMDDPTVRQWPQRPPVPQTMVGPPTGPQYAPIPPPPPPARRPMAPTGPPPERPSSGFPPVWRRRLLTALAIVAAALLGILVANAFVDTSGNTAAAGPAITDTTAPGLPAPVSLPPIPTATTDSDTSTLSVDATTTTPVAPTEAAGKPSLPMAAGVLHAYFGLLPQHPEQAWLLLGAPEQAKSGGFANFQRNWDSVASLQVSPPVPRGGGTLLVEMRLTSQAGQTTQGTYAFQFVSVGGQVLINDISQVGRQNKHG